RFDPRILCECALEHNPCGLAHDVLIGALREPFRTVRLCPRAYIAFLGSKHRCAEARGLHAPVVLTAEHVQGITRCKAGERHESAVNQSGTRLDGHAGVRNLREWSGRCAKRLPHAPLESVEVLAGIASRIAPREPRGESWQALADCELAQPGENLWE